jgi:hypothetical protein
MAMKEFDNESGQPYRVRAMKIGIGLGVVVMLGGDFSPTRTWAQDQKTPPAGTKPADPAPPAADEKPEAAPPADSGGPVPEGELRGDVSTLEEAAKVPNEEKQKRSEQMLAEMRAALKRGTELLQQARSAKDIRQLNCVNEKVTLIKGLLKVAEQASVKMYDGIAANNQTVVNHEYGIILLAHPRVVTLRSEAEQCVGEEAIYTGETKVSVDQGPQLVPPEGGMITPPGPGIPPIASNF